jgi:NitT/TauT family transport system ATP-binding protein
MHETIIEGRKLEKFYGDPGENVIQVIAPTDISVHADEIFGVLGPSGSGKSTLLRMLTGLSKPSAGEVLWHGNPVADQTPNVSIVFQSFALFPWLTVLENVEAPLKARGIGEIPRRKRSLKILETVGLDGFEGAYPKELSGGMKQRVGFARALVVEPEVLFMDEPFSALDVLTAENLRTELLELWANKSIPTRAVYIVTHNIEEAVLLADRIVVLGRNPGRIRTDFQVGLPQPRDRKSPAFLQIVDYVYKVLTQPDTAPQIAPDASAAPAGPGVPRAKYPMLPHTRPGGINGMLEILYDRDGHDDIYHLADDLAFEIDDVLPIVEASQMLGFLHVSEGDVELTPEGRRYVDSDIAERKEIFAKAALERVALVRQIRRALESKSNHTLPDEFFHDTLDEHFSEKETVQQLETAVNWGRYAGLFDYDAATRKFYIAEETEDKDKDVEEEAASL